MDLSSLVSALASGMAKCSKYITSLQYEQAYKTVLKIKIDGDTTQRIDLISENYLIDKVIKKLNYKINVITEEQGLIKLVDRPDYLILLDPLDGSDFFFRHIPLSNIALTLIDLNENNQIASIILEMATGKFYIAQNDECYTLLHGERRKIFTSSNEDLSKVFLSSYFVPKGRIQSLIREDKLINSVAHVFNFGGPLEIARVSEGAIDAYIEFSKGFKPIDYLPAFHICKNAGAIITDLNNRKIELNYHLYRRQKFLVSSNRQIHDKILNLINK